MATKRKAKSRAKTPARMGLRGVTKTPTNKPSSRGRLQSEIRTAQSQLPIARTSSTSCKERLRALLSATGSTAVANHLSFMQGKHTKETKQIQDLQDDVEMASKQFRAQCTVLK